MDLKCVLGTGRFSRATTAVKPLAQGQAARDSNFEDAVASFVYTARAPFHPGRLHDFLTSHFHLVQRDFSADMEEERRDAAKTIAEAADAIVAAAKVLPAHAVAAKAAAELAARAAQVVVAEMAAGEVQKVPEKIDATLPEGRPFGMLLRSKGQVRCAVDVHAVYSVRRCFVVFDGCSDWHVRC